MVSSDTVVGIVGAVILTGAMIAVFYYENTNADDTDGDGLIGEGDQTFTFTYVQSNATAVAGESKTIGSIGSSQEVTFTLPAYVFDLQATVTWSDDDAAPEQLRTSEDTLKVELINEAGTVLEMDENANGEITLSHGHGASDTNTTPPQKRVRVAADSEEEARQQLQEATADVHGAGTWTLRVTLVSTGSEPGAAQRDATQDFSVTVDYSFWEPQLPEQQQP